MKLKGLHICNLGSELSSELSSLSWLVDSFSLLQGTSPCYTPVISFENIHVFKHNHMMGNLSWYHLFWYLCPSLSFEPQTVFGLPLMLPVCWYNPVWQKFWCHLQLLYHISKGKSLTLPHKTSFAKEECLIIKTVSATKLFMCLSRYRDQAWLLAEVNEVHLLIAAENLACSLGLWASSSQTSGIMQAFSHRGGESSDLFPP